MRFHTLLLCLVLGACTASESGVDTGDESFASKREYSVLQGLEAEYRTKPNAGGIVVARNALGTDYVALGFPIAGRNEGFTWYLASTHDGRIRGGLPNEDFQLRRMDLVFVRNQAHLDPAMIALLEKHVQDGP